MSYRNDPREIYVRYDGTCAETGKRIAKGETCIYYPLSKKIYHPYSKQAKQFYSWQFDITALGANY